MKTKLSFQTWFLSVAWLTCLIVPLTSAQVPYPIGCRTNALLYECTITTNWIDAVDLDGDAIADFIHIDFTVEQTCIVTATHYLLDRTDGFFPRDNVQLYVQFDPWSPYLNALLQPQQSILLSPQDPVMGYYWAWNPPRPMPWLQAYGYGVTDSHEVWVIPVDPYGSETWSRGGFMGWTTNGLFGFRMAKADGWHLGWLRLLLLPEPAPRPDGKTTLVRLAEYEIHPEPDTAILAGQYVQPRLQIAATTNQVRLSWPAAYRGFTLERALQLAPPWETVSGVTNNAITLEAAGTPWFFRLRR